MHAFSKLPPFDRASGDLHVIIDTPKGSRNKFAWNEKRELFELSGVLPAGAVFPYDFGFVPNTAAAMAIPSRSSCSWTSPPLSDAWSHRASSA